MSKIEIKKLSIEDTSNYWLVLFFIVCTIFLISCRIKQEERSLPNAIAQKISSFSSASTCNDARVDEKKYQNNVVYVFEEGSCVADKETNVYAADGKLLGSLGGFAGNTQINGADFSSAVFIKTVWNKPSTN